MFRLSATVMTGFPIGISALTHITQQKTDVDVVQFPRHRITLSNNNPRLTKAFMRVMPQPGRGSFTSFGPCWTMESPGVKQPIPALASWQGLRYVFASHFSLISMSIRSSRKL